ncbi:MAG TPA: hypothetical protein VK081_13525 [Planctomycetota bacterium]|nr:hypothetical protein [Planctomycetota bacterium]
MNDIAYSTVDLSSFLTFGDGCGSAPTGGYQSPVGSPSIGNSSFAVDLLGGQPSAPAIFVFGASRTMFAGGLLPLRLDFVGMTGCSLYTDVIVTAGLGLDGSGGARLPLPIPGVNRVRGQHFTTQWFWIDPAANPASVAASDGGEIIVR